MRGAGFDTHQEAQDRFELKVAGIGGQGVLTAALLLARAGVQHYRHVTWFPSYNTQKRGGDADCTVILSHDRIHSPVLSRPQAMVVMHAAALQRFESQVAPGGIIIVDSSLVGSQVARDDLKSYYVQASAIGVELGSAQLANMVLIGAYLALVKAVPLESVEDALAETMAGGKQHIIAAGREGMRRGFAAKWHS